MSQTVLLVDDEPGVISTLGRTLRKEGYNLISASNGHDGLKQLREHHVDLVITDQRMPELSGSEMVAEMRKHHQSVPAIMLSGQSEMDDVVHAINEGKIHSYLKKPWDREALLSKVKSALIKGERSKQLQASAAFFVDSNQPGWVMDQHGDICFANEEFNNRFIKEHATDAGAVPALNIRNLLRKDQVIQLKRLCQMSLTSRDAEGHLIFLLPDYTEAPHKVLVRTVDINERRYYCIQFVNDLELCLLKQELDRLHKFDPCTGLLNRSTLVKELEQQLDAYPSEHFALAMVDIRHADDLRASLGEEGFEHLMFRIGQRLEPASRLIGRVSDNRFCALFGPYQFNETLESWSEDLKKLFQSAFEFGTQCVPVRPAIGMALYPEDANEVSGLIERAIRSAQSIEEDSASPWVSSLEDAEQFSNALGAVVACKQLMRSNIAKAIDTNRLTLQFQPLVCSETNAILGIDANLHWNEAKSQEFPFDDFLSHPENSKLACQLDHWIFNRAFAQMTQWRRKGYRHLNLALKMSSAWLRNENLERDMVGLLFDKPIDPSQIFIHISQETFKDLNNTVIANLDMLKERGFQLILDEFGVGLSSMEMMAELPIDGIRLHSALSGGLEASQKYHQIVSSILNLAHTLDLITLVKGIDTQEQQDMLESLELPLLFQGGHFGDAMNVDSVEQQLSVYRSVTE